MHPLERLVNLVALLLESPRPLTFDQIRDAMPEAYAQQEVATAKRMFERDKDILRDVGVPIEVGSTDAWDVEQGYTIPKDRYYLPEIHLTPEEISALFVAARAGGEDATAEQAVRKLLSGGDGGFLAGGSGTPIAAEGAGLDVRLLAAADAIGDRVAIRFTYRTSRGAESERHVDPYGLVVRGGQWYVVGLDRERGEVRSFRLSRMVGDLDRGGEATAPPEGFKAADHVAAGPWGPGEPQEHVLVAFSPDVAWWATSGVQGVETIETRPDGWQVDRVPTGPGDGIVSWVLSFGPDAELLEPAALRAETVRRLESLGA
jgi:predicted DNA-binding transcriptional regulator YafY